MIRIAFLGCDSTHTEAFAKLITAPGAPFEKVAQVCALWGVDSAQAAAKARDNNIPRVAPTIAEALEGADFAMVIGRFADSHAEPALEAIRRGVSVFVDKPFADSAKQTKAMIEAAANANVRLCSSSPLRFAREVVSLKARQGGGPATFLSSAPAVCTDLGPDPRLNSAFFYGIHALEMLLELAGDSVETKQITYGRRFINIHLDMVNGNAAQLQLVRDTPEFYSIGRIDQTGQHMATIDLDGSYYRTELDFLLNRFLTGGATISLKSSLTAVAILEEIDRNDRFRS